MFLYSTVSTLKPKNKGSAWLESLGARRHWTSLTDCRDGSNNFTEFQLVQDRSFSGSIKTDHQDSHLLLSPELIEQLRERETHISGCM